MKTQEMTNPGKREEIVDRVERLFCVDDSAKQFKKICVDYMYHHIYHSEKANVPLDERDELTFYLVQSLYEFFDALEPLGLDFGLSRDEVEEAEYLCQSIEDLFDSVSRTYGDDKRRKKYDAVFNVFEKWNNSRLKELKELKESVSKSD